MPATIGQRPWICNNDLGMNSTTGDSSLYVRKENVVNIGISGNYVDDQLNAGNEEFVRLTDATLKAFDSKPRIFDTFDFFGMQVRTETPSLVTLNQSHYARHLRPMPQECTFEQFRRDRVLFSWMTHTRPDMACIANRAAQVTDTTITKEHVKELNQGMKIVRSSPGVGLRFPKLGGGLHLRSYINASFGNNDYLSSQMGYVIKLYDELGGCHVLDFSSKKSRRVVRSVMGAEAYAFLDAFDAAYTISIDMAHLLDMRLPIFTLTDSRQVFDAITRRKRTTEKRLAIELAAARHSYRMREIERVGLIRGCDNPPDAFTKPRPNGVLGKLLCESKIDAEPLLWITRDDTGDPCHPRKKWECDN